MNSGTGRLVGAVAAAAILVGLFIIAIEHEGSFLSNALQIGMGFGVVMVVGFIVLNLRSTMLYFIATGVFLLSAYLVYKAGWKTTMYGVVGAALLNTILHVFWVRPNTSTQFNSESYAREQQKIREGEKGGSPTGPGALPGKES